MEYYYYKHDASEIPFDDVNGKKKLITEKAHHYCEHCGTDIIGFWEYYDMPIDIPCYLSQRRAMCDIGSRFPLCECFRTGNYAGTVDACKKINTSEELSFEPAIKKPFSQNDFEIKYLKQEYGNQKVQYFYKKGYNQLLSLIDKYQYILEYRKEALKFLKLNKCPICGNPFAVHCSSFSVVFKYMSYYGEKSTEFNIRERDIDEAYSGLGYRGFYVYPREETKNFNAKSGILYDGGRKDYIDGDSVYPSEWDELGKKLGCKIEDALTYYEQMKILSSKESANRRLEETVRKFKMPIPTQNSEINIAEDVKELTGYLEQILFAEENIYLLSERLKDLYPIEAEANSSYKILSLNADREKENLLKCLENEYESICSEKPEKEIKLSNFPISMPKQPAEPIKPIYPTLDKPGLFNKKRVMAENEIKLNNYNEEFALYEEKYSKYKTELSAYHSTVEELKAQQKEKFEAKIAEVIQNHKEKCKELSKKINKLKNEMKKLKEPKAYRNTPQAVKCLYIENEVSQVEKLLQNFYKLRNDLYSCGVIFEKYRNYVAVAMFYEYIKSGRCEKLESPTGAYNLYESEVRANIVISNLNKIVDSLEKIQENQYMIYSGISRMNKELEALNYSTSSMLESLESVGNHLSSIDSNLGKVEKNTSAIAQNTETAAFYAKKNAELTNALGYLMALS